MLAAALVYVNALDNPFVYDDLSVIVENRSLLDLTNVSGVILHDISRPLVNLSYAVDYTLWGADPVGFHLTNVLLHVANVGVLFVLALRLLRDGRSAFLTAGLFAVHPMMSGAVGYASARSELLSTLFVLLAFLAVRHWIARDHGVGRLAVAVGCWVCALASKESAIVFPAIVFWYERFVVSGSDVERRRRLWQLHVPLLGLAALFAVTRLAVFAGVEHPDGVQVFWQYGLVEIDVVRRYLALLVLPVGQTIFHDVSPIGGLLDWRAWPGLGVVGCVGAAAWWLRYRLPVAGLGAVWFLLVLVPAAVLVMLDRGEPMVEHRVYLASCGFFVAIGSLVGHLWQRDAKPQVRVGVELVVGVMLAALAAGTVARNAVWGDPVALWTESANKAPDAWFPRLLLGEAQHAAGQHSAAIRSYQSVIQTRPETDASYARLGLCLTETGDLPAASAAYGELARRDPGSAEARNGLGVIALMSGRPEEARRQFRATLSAHPLNVEARRGLAMLAESIGDPAEALRLCNEIAGLAPFTPGNDDCIARNLASIGGGL